ncbi:MAG: hypothetical protein E7353_10005 [Clostridiales bacterium]|nr:hypothetical protein [Clostridiales bacterium]
MFKHQDIIDKLTPEQKFALIADISALGGTEGFSFIKEKDLNDFDEWRCYPNFNSLANSWNPELINVIGYNLFTNVKADGVNLVTLPNAGVKISPYSQGLSEDGHLSSTLVGTLASQGKTSGLATCLFDPQIEKVDVDYLDATPSVRAVYEYLFRTQHSVLRNDVVAIKVTDKAVGEGYDTLNKNFIEKLESKFNIIYDKRKSSEEGKRILKYGNFYNGASTTEIREAYARYTQLKNEYESGVISLADVHAECEAGTAISDEMIDSAVDKILDLTDLCSNSVGEAEKGFPEQLVFSAMSESTVMLKNEHTLPLFKGTKIAVVGEIAEKEELGSSLSSYLQDNASSTGYQFVGYEKGYCGAGRDVDLAQKAINLATQSDVVLLALGYGKKESEVARKIRNCKLPANQEEILRRLAKTGKKIVVLLYGGCEVDMSFDVFCKAILMMPSYNAYANKTLLDMLSGQVSPGGRLKNTLYSNTDKYFTKLKNYKNAGRNDVGVFYGYRHYDTAGKVVKYPFGYGLSYGNFVYSGLAIRGGIVSFNVKNTGRITASEAVQVYVGKNLSSVIRPKKELKFFKKITLKPGGSMRISFKINDLRLSIYDEEKKKFSTESGKYNLYVGSSVCDIKLTSSFYVAGESIQKDELKKNMYFQNLGNIQDGQYYLEEPVKLPRRAQKNGSVRFVTILFFAVIFLSLMYGYLNFIGLLPGGLIPYSIIGGLVVILLICIMISKSNTKRIIRKCVEKSKKMKQIKRENLDEKEIYDPIPYEELFATEFAEPVINIADDEGEVEEEKEVEGVEYVFDPDFTITQACDELTLFAKERGVDIDAKSVRALFSSFASSKLIIFNSENKQLLAKFVGILGKYFEYDAVIENFEDVHLGGNDIINSVAPCYPNGITNIAQALLGHSGVENHVRLMILDKAQTEFIKPCYAHLFRYFDQPHSKNILTIHSNGEDIEYIVPENLWFGIILDDEQKAYEIPRYILEVASEVTLVLSEAEIEENFEEIEEEKENYEVVGGEDASVEAIVEDEAEEEVIAEEAPVTEEEVIAEEAPVTEEVESFEEANEKTEQVVAMPAENSDVVSEEVQQESADEQATEEQPQVEEQEDLAQFDQDGKLIPKYTPDGRPIAQYDQNGVLIPQFDQNGMLIPLFDKQGRPIAQYDQNGRVLLQFDQYGRPIVQYDRFGKAVPQFDHLGNPIPVFDEDGNMVPPVVDEPASVQEQKPEENEQTAEQVIEENVEQAEEFTQEQIEQVEENVEEQEEIPEDEGKTPVKKVTFYQFTRMVEIAVRDNNMDETLWKRIDKLEDNVSAKDATYSLSSKLWRRLEKYASVYMSAGGDFEETLDSVVASHVINTMIESVANSKTKTDERFVNVVENIFGEGHVPSTVHKVKSTGLKI